jgi:hypothetical protein
VYLCLAHPKESSRAIREPFRVNLGKNLVKPDQPGLKGQSHEKVDEIRVWDVRLDPN